MKYNTSMKKISENTPLLIIEHSDYSINKEINSFKKRVNDGGEFVVANSKIGKINSEVNAGSPQIIIEFFNHFNYSAVLFLDLGKLGLEIFGIIQFGQYFINLIRNAKTPKDLLLLSDIDRVNNFPLKVGFIFNRRSSKQALSKAIDIIPITLKYIKNNITNYNDCEIICLNYLPHEDLWDCNDYLKYKSTYGATTSLNVNRTLKSFGILPEKDFPDKPNETMWELMNAKITPKQERKALIMKTEYYQRLNTTEEIINSLNISPITVSIEIFDNFIHPKDGLIEETTNQAKIGNHAISIYSYSEDKKLIKFLNSWGPNWGDNGYGYLSLDYFKKYFIESWIGAPSILCKNIKILKEGTTKDLRAQDIPFKLAQVPSLNSNQSFYVINLIDPLNNNKYLGWCHFYINQNNIEIEEIFIDIKYRGLGLGSNLIKILEEQIFTLDNIILKEILGYISISDIPNETIDYLVCNFWSKNGYSVVREDSRFRGCYYKIFKKINKES